MQLLHKLPEETHQFIEFTREMGSRAEFGDDPAVTQYQVSFPARDGYNLRAQIFRPAEAYPNTRLPVIVLYHGGGYTIGQPIHCTPLARAIISAFSVVVVAPQYRLAPEYPFPFGINDAWDGLQYVAKHATGPEIGATPDSGFVVGGFSTGASMSSVLCHLARDYDLSPPLTGVYIACGSNCPPAAVPGRFRHRYLSRTQVECNSDLSLNAQLLNLFMNSVKPDILSPLFSSFLWPSGHSNLPPVYFQIAGREYSRDEALIYADVLREASVDVKADIYKGVPHCWWVLFPHLHATSRWRRDTVEGMRWLFRR